MDESTGTSGPHEIMVEESAGATEVVLRGEIDASLRAAASECMITVLAGRGPLVIDTSAVTFIDSSGLAFLLQLQSVASDAGRSVTLRDPSGVVVDLLAMVGLDSLFTPNEPQGV